MKKKIYLFTAILGTTAALFLSSCLKDKSHYVDFSKGGTFVDFPLGGFVNLAGDAITETPDTDANGTIVRQFAVNVASANLPTSPTTVTIAVGDASDVNTLNGLQSNVVYELMPSNAYVLATTKVIVPAGKQYANTSITFYKNLLDPSKSYVLPVKITNGGGQKISGNLNVHYFHFIGNDFAGAYEHFYTRWNNADTTTAPSTPRTDLGPTTFSPVSPTEFTVATNYYTGPNYDVTFTKTGSGPTATYSNWAIRFLPADISGGLWAANITVVTPPKFASLHYAFDAGTQYTYAQSLTLMRFYFKTASRGIIDDYTHL